MEYANKIVTKKIVIPVIINGSGGVGKDTFVECCKSYSNSFRINWFVDVQNFSSVELIKTAASVIGWEGKKTEKDRKFLSDLKKLAKEYNNCSIKYMAKQYNTCKNSLATHGIFILFFHIREPEEIEEFKGYVKDPVTVLITRDSVDKILSNSSDANVTNYNYDYTIANNGTEDDLYKSAKVFIDSMINNKIAAG